MIFAQKSIGMVKVTIRVVSWPTTDVWARYHGLGVDQELDETFWNTQPHKIIGVTRPERFEYTTQVDLAPGEHTVEYATSGYVPDYAWHAIIYVNEQKVAEGDVGRFKQHHLRAKFTVSPGGVAGAVPWWIIAAIGVAVVGAIAGVAYYAKRRRA